MKQLTNERGSVEAIVMGLLVVALIGALGFIFWQNFLKKDEPQKTVETVKEEPKPVTVADETEEQKGYLAINEWSVRFKIPSEVGSETVFYEKAHEVTGLESGYGIITSGEKKLYNTCGLSPEPQVYVHRGKNSQSTPEHVPLNSGKSLGGYYYFMSATMTRCEDSNQAKESEYQNILKSLVETIEIK